MAKKLKEEETIVDEEKAEVKTSPVSKKNKKKKDAPAFPRHKSDSDREVEAMQAAHPGKEEQVVAELTLRKYVSRSGGFRRGVPPEDKKKAERLMKLLGRDEPVWDIKLIP